MCVYDLLFFFNTEMSNKQSFLVKKTQKQQYLEFLFVLRFLRPSQPIDMTAGLVL